MNPWRTLINSEAWNGEERWGHRYRSLNAYLFLSALFIPGYVLLAKLGLTFSAEGSDTAFIWPPSGFSTAVLFLLGMRFLPAAVIGSCISNVMFSHLSPSSIALIICVDTIEMTTAVSSLRLLGFHARMGRMRDVVVFIFATVIIAASLAAALGTAVFGLDGQMSWAAFGENWSVYWVANAMANLSIAPFLFAWADSSGVLFQKRKADSYWMLELLVLLILTLVIGYWTWLRINEEQYQTKLEYLLFPVLIWAAIRFGPKVSSLVILVVTVIAILVTAGVGNAALQQMHSHLFSAQMFLAVYAVTGHLLAGTAEEHAATETQLNRARNELEDTVAERTEDLLHTSQFLEAVFDKVASAVIAVDAKGKLTHSNWEARRLFKGLEDEHPDGWAAQFAVQRTDGTPMPEHELPIARAAAGESLRNVELTIKGDSGQRRHMLVSGQPIISKDGNITGAVVAAHDVTEQKESQDLQQLFSKATVIANEAPDTEQAVLSILELICNYTGWATGHALRVESNRSGRRAISTGWWYDTEEQPVPQTRSVRRISEGEGVVDRVLVSGRAEWQAIAREKDLSITSHSDSPTISSILAFPVLAESDLVAILQFFAYEQVEPDTRLIETMYFVCGQLGRVYERQLSTQKLMSMTLRDPLTGMPNRLAFNEVLIQAVAHARRRQNYSFAVLFLDLDRFKIINDSLGHAAGDQVIRETAARIQSCLRDGDSMARLGGDEFTVFLDDLGQRSDSANAIRVARRINAEIARPIIIADEEVQVSSSIGIVISNPDYEVPDAIMRDADAAMYRAKAEGRSQAVVFSPQMHFTAMHQLRMENDLRQALKRREFRLFYQPVVRLQTGALTGFEALIRWDHPERGLILPGEFLPICEEAGLIVPLGEWTIMEACRWMGMINQAMPDGAEPLTISVNISSVHFAKGVVVGQVENAVASGMIKAGQLKLEVVESALVKNPAEAVYVIEALKAHDIEVMIDDFGTGYSSLSYLATLPIDALKIDRSFVHGMMQNENSSEVVRCIISMADALGLSVIGEGIETEEQAEALQNLGCAFGQGYHFYRPLPENMATDLCLASANIRK